MVAHENIPPIYPDKETSTSCSVHVASVVLVGGNFEVDLLGESKQWLIASVPCDRSWLVRPVEWTLYLNITSTAHDTNHVIIAESFGIDVFNLLLTWCLIVLSWASQDLSALSAAPLAL